MTDMRLPPPAESDQRLIDDWPNAVWMEKGLSEHSLSNYRRDLTQFAGWLVASRRASLQRCSRVDLYEYLSWQHQRGINPRSVSRHLSALRGCFRWLLRERYISEDPTLRVQRPKTGRPLPKILTEADV